MFLVGFMGGIGSGKMIVVDLFGVCGVLFVDIDLIVYCIIVLGGFVMLVIEYVFGCGFVVVDGLFDCVKMCILIFSDDDVCWCFEVIMYLLICVEIDCEVCEVWGLYVMFVVLLFVELGMWKVCSDCVLVVDCLVEM